MIRQARAVAQLAQRIYSLGRRFPRVAKVLKSLILVELFWRSIGFVLELISLKFKLLLISAKSIESEALAYMEWLGNNRNLVKTMDDKSIATVYSELRVNATADSEIGKSVLDWQKALDEVGPDEYFREASESEQTFV